MKKYLLLIIAFWAFRVSAQIDCGTNPTKEQLQFMRENIDSRLASRSSLVETVRIPLKFHIIRRSDGSGGLSESRISSLISQVNQEYSPIGFEFFQSGEVNYINSNEFYDLDASQEGQLAGPNDLGGVINIYVSNRLSSGSSNLCGYTYFPPSADRIFLAQGCVTNGPSTTIHELGHYFSLFHTHGKTNNGTTDELVDGSNCQTAGDNVCDTPADPNLSGNIASGCSYVGNSRDANGQTFSPDPSNIMSYAPSSCRTKLTAGQLDRALTGLNGGRSYLNLQYTSFTPRLRVTSFEGCNPYTVTFSDITSGSVIRTWQFEGANIERSTQKEVTVTYNEPGLYDVTLKVTNQGGIAREIVREDYIRVSNVYNDTISTEKSYLLNEDFFPLKWEIDNKDRQESFELTEYANGESAIKIGHFNYLPVTLPAVDDLELSNLSLREAKSFRLSFDVSYKNRPISIANYDELQIGFKTNCDNNFELVTTLTGEELSIDTTSSEYIIDENSVWKSYTVDFDFEELRIGQTNFVVVPVIRSIGNNNNNIYIDNVKITPDFSLERPTFFRYSELTEDFVELRWFNESSNIRKTVIERSFDQENWIEIGTAEPGNNIFRDSIRVEEVENIYYRAFASNNVTNSSYSDIEVVNQEILSVNESIFEEISYFPNPFSNNLTISNVPEGSAIEISSIEGRILYQTENTTNSEITISALNHLNSGLFILKLYNESLGGYKTFNLVKN